MSFKKISVALTVLSLLGMILDAFSVSRVGITDLIDLEPTEASLAAQNNMNNYMAKSLSTGDKDLLRIKADLDDAFSVDAQSKARAMDE